MKKLFLFDTMALVYRAHFALSKNPRINSKGLNTGAIMGFVNTLLEVITKEKPTHMAVCTDVSGKSFRNEMFAEYKANRQDTPEDILEARPWIEKIVHAFNIPYFGVEGYEADDIIGTLAKQAVKEGFEVYMMTPDKDYAQLVEENIFLYRPAALGKGAEKLGIAEVQQKFGIERPEQVIDLLGLQGDASDNIPGVPGIGPKTAVKLLGEYDSVEGVIENTQKLKGKQKQNLEEYAEQAILSKKLATINVRVPEVQFEEEKFAYQGYNTEQLKPIFEELEFRTLSKRLFGESDTKSSGKSTKVTQEVQGSLFGGEQAATQAPAKPQAETDSPSDEQEEEAPETLGNLQTTEHEYHLVTEAGEIDLLIAFLQRPKVLCFDTETTSTNPYEAELVGLSFCYFKTEAFYVPIPQEGAAELIEKFRPVFENPDILKVGQNLKYDLLVLRNYGIQVKGKLFDTMLAHYLLDPESRHNMDFLARQYLSYEPLSIETLIGKKGKNQGNMRDVDPKDVAEYAGEDADITFQLYRELDPLIREAKLESLLHDLEMPLMRVLADMEATGVRLDSDSLKTFSQELAEDIEQTEAKIHELAGEPFNVASPKQLGEILFDKLKLVDNPKKTKTGQYATNEETLASLQHHEIVARLLHFRQMQKLKSTYVDALPLMVSPKDQLIHTSYQQTVAATGRLSSNNPNLQNIPIRTERGRELRKAFVPRADQYLFMAADYSQVELRIMAAFSQDEHMIEAFRSGRDIHATTAAKIFGVSVEDVTREMRSKAKTANFGIIYGISAFGLSQRLNIPRKEAADIIEAYFKEFPAVKAYMDEVINFAREHEYVETVLGRRRYLRDINSRNHTQRGFAERNAINAPIQGSAADIIKKAMITIHDWMAAENLKSKMILQVHDELVFDIHRDEQDIMQTKIKELMENAHPLAVPLEVEVGFGENWLEAH